jgi:hypothetical protein
MSKSRWEQEFPLAEHFFQCNHNLQHQTFFHTALQLYYLLILISDPFLWQVSKNNSIKRKSFLAHVLFNHIGY